MPVSLLPKLLLYIIIIGYSPGPANVYALSCALKYGRKRALNMWRGLLTGFSIAVVLVAVAAHLLGTAMGEDVIYLRYAGAAYILWLAWNIVRNDVNADESHHCTFVDGMIVQLTNVKMILFAFTAYGTFVLPYTNTMIALLEVAVLLLLAGPVANLFWLLVGAWMRPFFLHYHRIVNVVMAVSLVACAVMVAIG
ncbi:MAG: LysE family transporter [Bacteroidales bacterium]|nr:LysE family transporter [Candidatus Sodaliphilus aphodohippi]